LQNYRAEGNDVVRTPTGGAHTYTWKISGLSQDDVMYLIMPDRFANGDPANDEPADAPGSHDRFETARVSRGRICLG